ncbi:hypothetical protein F9817_08240 [Vibrio sp. CAIM 722]|uniref:DUF3899 domain-containing protein n=1 Tax=Vibrio eleionomae TaxID=2653505 RepID=A0A7X4LJQ0_9VIBR|nr:hypothetical protein [Vibrio eleionomae]MZI93184.1 hypothetical protein [Vibrio eleionomae]
MKGLIKIVFIVNLVAALIVFILSRYVQFFKATSLSDFLFFVLIVIWALAKLLWEGGVESKVSRYDDPVTDKVYGMVEGLDFVEDEQNRNQQNYQTGLVLFIAGLPAFLALLVMQFL